MGPLAAHLGAIYELLAVGERPTEVDRPLGTIRLIYIDDDEDGPYAYFAFDLPGGVFAEIDDGTWGELQDIRIRIPNDERADDGSSPGQDICQDGCLHLDSARQQAGARPSSGPRPRR